VALLADQPSYSMYAEQIPDSAVPQLISWAKAGLDPHSGAAALWWLRNQFFTALGLDSDPRVLLIKYESFVEESEGIVREICAHIGVPFDDSLVAEVHAGSVGRRPAPVLEASVAAACDDLLSTLDRHWHSARTAGPVSSTRC
jgi:hypothetical protein